MNGTPNQSIGLKDLPAFVVRSRGQHPAKSALAKAGVPYSSEDAPPGTVAHLKIGSSATVDSFAGSTMSKPDFKAASEAFGKSLKAVLVTAGYPAKADMTKVSYPALVALCAYLVFLVTMVYGPIAAWLVEMFPTRIRYSSMSLPYHIGNGWFGGFLPVTGGIYDGLWYPVIVAAFTAVIGFFFLSETKGAALK